MASAELSAQDSPRTPWWLILIEGISLIIIGILLLARTGISTVILVQVLGIYWLIMGIVRIISIFIDSSQWGWKLIAGALGIIAGFIVIQHPLWSTAILTETVIIILGLTGIVIGVISIIQAFKGAGWGTGLMGLISIILGIVLLANAWVLAFSLPATLGILALLGGIVTIFGAFRVRREEDELAASAAPASVPEAVEESVQEAVAEPAAEAVEETVDEAAGEVEAAPAVVAAVAETATEPVEEEVEKAAAEEAAAETPELEHHALRTVEGIGPAYAEKLAAIGIESTESLLERGATPKGRADIANESGISGKLILTWVNHADLMRIKGVASQYADLLEEAGVDTIPDLARRNADNLYEKIVAVNTEKKLTRRTPSQEQVAGWVEMAKELPRIIQY